jgi:hypothetical protein
MTPEAKARIDIDKLLAQAGWHVCGMGDFNIHAAQGVAIREFPLNPGFGFADYLLYVNGKACGVIEAKKAGAIRLVDGVFPEFVAAYINSHYGKQWIKSVVTQQVGQANVNGTKLQALVVPLPPAAEQGESLLKLTAACPCPRSRGRGRWQSQARSRPSAGHVSALLRFDVLFREQTRMADFADTVDRLKPFPAVLERDECWRVIGNRSLEQHHALIAQYALHSGVPQTAAQHYENARNTWLYAFFSYRLLQVAVLQVHLAGEAAIKERARREGMSNGKNLKELLDIALERRWLLDSCFEVTADRDKREAEHLEMLRFMGVTVRATASSFSSCCRIRWAWDRMYGACWPNATTFATWANTKAT